MLDQTKKHSEIALEEQRIYLEGLQRRRTLAETVYSEDLSSPSKGGFRDSDARMRAGLHEVIPEEVKGEESVRETSVAGESLMNLPVRAETIATPRGLNVSNTLGGPFGIGRPNMTTPWLTEEERKEEFEKKLRNSKLYESNLRKFVNFRDTYGKTALHYACINGNQE